MDGGGGWQRSTDARATPVILREVGMPTGSALLNGRAIWVPAAQPSP